MKQSVQWPLRTVSEANTRGHWGGRAGRSASQRESTKLVLRSSLERRTLVLVGPNGERAANFFNVTLCRISAGELDDDNLRGALKAVRDEVAEWIGVDDRDPRVRFHYRQQECPKTFFAVRVEVDDLIDPDRVVDRVLGIAPTILGAPAESTGRGRRRVLEVSASKVALPKPPVGQERITFMRCYALLPWDQDGSGDPVVTELDHIDGERPPRTILVRAPHGRITTLFVHRWRHDELGECWLYRREEALDVAM